MFWLFYHLFGLWSWPILQCDMPTQNFHAIFCLFSSMLHYTLLSTQIFCSFSFNFHRFFFFFGVGGRDVCLGSRDLRLEWPWTCWYGEYRARIVVKIIASVCEPNETKRKLREKNNKNTISIVCVRVCVESVYLVVCLSRGTAKTLERCRQRYTIGAIGASHTTRQFVFGWVVSEPPLEFIFRE